MNGQGPSRNWDTAQMPRFVRDSGGATYVPPHEKAREQQALTGDVDAFLAAGGKIEVIPQPGCVRDALEAEQRRYRQRHAAERSKRTKGRKTQAGQGRKGNRG